MRCRDNLEGVDEDGSWLVFQVEIVVEQTDVAPWLSGKTATMVCSPSVVITVPRDSPPTSKLAVWRTGWWSFMPAIQRRHTPAVSGGPTGGDLAIAGAETGDGADCWGWLVPGGVGAAAVNFSWWGGVWQVEPAR